MVALLRRSEARVGPWWFLVFGLGLFALMWWLLGQLARNAFFGNTIITDAPVYYGYAEKMIDGQLPYRDFPLEYPPLALPFFLVPRLLAPGGDLGTFTVVFEGLMLACGLAAVLFLYITLVAVKAGPLRMGLALALAAVAPVLMGPVILSHFDLWPAALAAAAVAAVVTRHERIGAALLALGALAKVYPAVLLPVLLVYVWRRQGREEALRTAAVALVVGLVVLLPFVVLSPGGIMDALVRQVERPLQVESLGAALLFAWQNLGGTPVEIVSSFGSQNLAGPAADSLALLQTLVLVASLIGVWVWLWRLPGPLTAERFLRGAVASVCLYIALGKVLSPQYLAWLLPVVPLLRGRRAVAAGVAAAAAYVFTAAYFPAHYFPMVRGQEPGAATTVLLRDLSLVALAAVVVLPVNRMWAGLRGLLERLRAAIPFAAIRAHPGQLALLILIGAFVLRTIWLTQPAGSLIFDESYYVNAARVIDGIPVPAGMPYADAPAGIDPNTEHPPLGKLAIAASIRIFGDDAYGWRLPSVLAAILALAFVYLIVLAAGETAWLALLAMAIFALDNLAFVHGRIGTLDMMALAAMLAGAWLGLKRRPGWAGVAFAIGSLIRVTSVFGLLAFVLLEAIALYRRRREVGRIALPDLRPLGAALGAYAVVGVVGLWAMDLRFTNFANPIDHLRQMFGYGLNLTGGPSLSGIASNPWDWIVGSGHFDYLRVDVNSIVNGTTVASHPTVEFQGAISPVLIGAAPLVALFGLWLAVRGRHRLAEWGVVWIAANYLPFWVMAGVLHRITYLYYILPAIPALAVLTAVFLLRANLPRLVAYGYLAASLLAFIAYFPFREIPG